MSWLQGAFNASLTSWWLLCPVAQLRRRDVIAEQIFRDVMEKILQQHLPASEMLMQDLGQDDVCAVIKKLLFHHCNKQMHRLSIMTKSSRQSTQWTPPITHAAKYIHLPHTEGQQLGQKRHSRQMHDSRSCSYEAISQGTSYHLLEVFRDINVCKFHEGTVITYSASHLLAFKSCSACSFACGTENRHPATYGLRWLLCATHWSIEAIPYRPS